LLELIGKGPSFPNKSGKLEQRLRDDNRGRLLASHRL